MSDYQYVGYLETILYKPDQASKDNTEGILISGHDMTQWVCEDLDETPEWKGIPARKAKTKDGVVLKGDFQSVKTIDRFADNDPQHWVPLSTLALSGENALPIDTDRYPIVELTYRCTSENAYPSWMWTYAGASHVAPLPRTTEWKTVAKSIQHFSFPAQIDNIIFRLYSATRSSESLEIKSIRFRSMTPEETEAVERHYATLAKKVNTKTSPQLKNFLPLGVYMDAKTARRLAEMLNITLDEYWDLVMEDLLMHHHNTISLSHIDQLAPAEWDSLLQRCKKNNLKLVPRHDYPLNGSKEEQERIIETCIAPYADSEEIFCHNLIGEPTECTFPKMLEAKEAIEAADPNHPLAVLTRYPNAYALYAPFFQASGVGHSRARNPWDCGDMVSAHLPLCKSQQFWVGAPTFMYPTHTPPWSSCPELRLMFNLALANGARGWFSYSYHNDPVWILGRVQRTLTGPFLAFSDLWSELSTRMRYAQVLSPLLLEASPVDTVDEWFRNSISCDTQNVAAPGIDPISLFQLHGDDFDLYIIINNSVRNMASINIDIPEDTLSGKGMYDLTSYITGQVWHPIRRKRHEEMFPGSENYLLVATHERCKDWCDIMTQRMITMDLAKIKYSLQLAQQYGLPCKKVESTLKDIGDTPEPRHMGIISSARTRLVDLLHQCAPLTELEMKLYHARAMICGCDGAICRLLNNGHKEKAMTFGDALLPLTAEVTHLRLELKQGRAEQHIEGVKELLNRISDLLNSIRMAYGKN